MMATIKVKEKFPCGYEINVTIRALIGTPFYKQDGECPLHGKRCVKLRGNE